MTAPVATAMTAEPATTSRRRADPTGNRNGCPPMKIVCDPGKDVKWVLLRARNAPYRIRNVDAVKEMKTADWRLRVFQKTCA